MAHINAGGNAPHTGSSSGLVLNPVPANVLALTEARRRDANVKLGYCRSGCAEVDDYALLGGLERGSVVGISAEEEEHFGLTLALQILARSLCSDLVRRALIVTPKPASAVLRPLRDAVAAQARLMSTADAETDGAKRTKECLDRVMLSCVFDVDGVREVLADLDKPPPSSPPSPDDEPQQTDREANPEPVTEIQDSEDEDEYEDDSEDKPQPPPINDTPIPTQSQSSSPPEIIIITHFATLLTGLFTHRTSPAARSALRNLSFRLRHLSRTLPSSPLILLLNSTQSSSNNNSTPSFTTSTSTTSSSKPLDPTLRSIFNPPPASSTTMAHGQQASATITALADRNKPSWGLTFTHGLDLHLLCTRVPRTDSDADLVYAGIDAPRYHHHNPVSEGLPLGHGTRAEFVTVVEVLLDEMGVWQGRRGKRQSREQRWAAVQITRGIVENAFEPPRTKTYSNIRLAAGFGGPRV